MPGCVGPFGNLVQKISDSREFSGIVAQVLVVHIIYISLDNQVSQISGSAVHAGNLHFVVQNIFFIIAQIKAQLMFSGSVCHFVTSFFVF